MDDRAWLVATLRRIERQSAEQLELMRELHKRVAKLLDTPAAAPRREAEGAPEHQGPPPRLRDGLWEVWTGPGSGWGLYNGDGKTRPPTQTAEKKS